MERPRQLLFLTFYFPPDLCAGSFRAEPLVQALREQGGQDWNIEVLTTMPNRYHTHVSPAAPVETDGPVTVRRLELPRHRSGMLDQAKAFRAYAAGVRRLTAGRRYDIVLATSSRLMTAALGAHVARATGARLYLDIRDLFTDTIKDVAAGRGVRLLLPFLRLLERRTIRAAGRVNLVSPGFLPHMRKVSAEHEYRLFSHGIDDDFLQASFVKPPTPGPLLIVYAGNLGEGQGLHHILPAAAKRLEGTARFRIIGDGGRREHLMAAVRAAGISNVEFLNPIPRRQLQEHYRAADILFTHLNDHPAFLKVMPSKLFEYAATEKRLLAGVAGYAAEFLQREVPGAEIFNPCDIEGLFQGVARLAALPAQVERRAFREKYGRQAIMREMARDILAVAPRV